MGHSLQETVKSVDAIARVVAAERVAVEKGSEQGIVRSVITMISVEAVKPPRAFYVPMDQQRDWLSGSVIGEVPQRREDGAGGEHDVLRKGEFLDDLCSRPI